MRPIIFMFPGQSSRYPEMLDKLQELFSVNRTLMEHASDLLHRDLRTHYHASNAEMFSCNRDVQIGVFLANHMFLQGLESFGVKAQYSLGLSLGEWNHLVHIGALPFETALLAVEQRGLAYDAGPEGSMASFFPIRLEELEPIIERARQFGQLEAVNLNSPRQTVLAGEHAALDEALRLASEELFVDGVVIERQVPMHASMFAPVGQQFRQVLQNLPFQSPHIPYLPNRLGQFVEHPGQQDFVELLSTHVHHPVLWQRSIDFLLEQLPQAMMVEVGAKSVLYNLFDRKWHKDVLKYKTDSRENSLEYMQTMATQILQQSSET